MSDKKPGEEPQKTKDVPLIDKTSGVYANLFQVSHNQEEFHLLFITLVNEVAQVTSKVIVTPGHMKRLVDAMQENVQLYESRFGQINAAPRFGNVGEEQPGLMSADDAPKDITKDSKGSIEKDV